MKIVTVFCMMFGLLIAALGQKSSLLVYDSQNTKEMCSPLVEGLQLCTLTPNISVKLGQSVIVNLALKNWTQEDLSVSTMSAYDPVYEFHITDQNGNKLLSKLEVLKKKDETQVLSEAESNELFERCCINVASRGDLQLARYQVIKQDFNLSQSFDFSKKGKYFIEIERNVLNQKKSENAKISLPVVAVELK